MVDSLVKLGQLAICLALALSLYAAAQAVLSVSGRAPARLRAARNGLYASMWNRQREAVQAEEQLKKVRESDELGVILRGAPAAE